MKANLFMCAFLSKNVFVEKRFHSIHLFFLLFGLDTLYLSF